VVQYELPVPTDITAGRENVPVLDRLDRFDAIGPSAHG